MNVSTLVSGPMIGAGSAGWENLFPPNVFCPARQNSFQLQCIFLPTKLRLSEICTGFIENGSPTYKVFFAVVNCDVLKMGLRWGSETTWSKF